jgi:hypothetical protein
VAKEPGHRGARNKLLKPSRRECRLIAAYLWLLTRVLFVAHAAAGATRTRYSLRPLTSRGWFAQHLGRYLRRVNAKHCLFPFSPFLRREGWDEGVSPLTMRVALTRPALLRFAGDVSPQERGEVTQNASRSAFEI